MTHPDPRIEAIRQRNARELAEATNAPPPEIANDFAAYLQWKQLKPPAEIKPPRQLPYKGYRRKHHKVINPSRVEIDPRYVEAAAHLVTLPDMGGALIEQARAELGDLPISDLAIHAHHIAEGNRP